MIRFMKVHIFFVALVLPVVLFLHNGPAVCQEDMEDAGQNEILAILYPLKMVTLSAEISSVVNEIRHEMGEEFKKGEILMVFDSGYFWADKKKAEAALLSATAVFNTKKELYKYKSVSELEYAEADAGLRIAKRNLSIANKRLGACTIRAPYRGRVLKLQVNENELVGNAQPLIEIIDDWVIRAKFLVPFELYEKIKIGQTFTVQVREAKMEFECKVTHISPVLESNTSTFQVFAEIDNSSNILRGGMTGKIILESIKGD